jgi:DNA helicase HerA-like ATPase
VTGENKIEIVTGRKGQGKTSLAYHRARLSRRGVAVFDPNAQFRIGSIVRDAACLSVAMDDPAVTLVVFQPHGEVWADFEQFQQTIFGKREIAVIVDEASLLGSPQRISPALDQLIRLGRTKDIDIFLTAHRPQDLNGIVFSLADTFCFFHTTHPRDLQRIEDFTSAELRERVQQLGPHEFACWSVEAEQFFVNTAPEGWREQIAPETPREIHTEEQFEKWPNH